MWIENDFNDGYRYRIVAGSYFSDIWLQKTVNYRRIFAGEVAYENRVTKNVSLIIAQTKDLMEILMMHDCSLLLNEGSRQEHFVEI